MCKRNECATLWRPKKTDKKGGPLVFGTCNIMVTSGNIRDFQSEMGPRHCRSKHHLPTHSTNQADRLIITDVGNNGSFALKKDTFQFINYKMFNA